MTQQISHSLVQALAEVPDFSTLDNETLLDIVGESMNLFWKAGSHVFEPGSPAAAFYVVISGECAILDDGGTEVARPKTGDSFGEMSLLLEATHSRSAVAVTDCEILVIPKESFSQLLQSNPALAEHFRRVLEQRRAERAAGVVAS